MVLAVDEVCANLIIHSHKCNPGAAIELSIRNSKEGIEFEIIDRDAVYFDLESHEIPNIRELIDKKKKGGVGLWLVKQFMDKVEVEYKDTQSTWRLYKDLPLQTRV
jgi:serine/threonine-protein kinase RsbW